MQEVPHGISFFMIVHCMYINIFRLALVDDRSVEHDQFSFSVSLWCRGVLGSASTLKMRAPIQQSYLFVFESSGSALTSLQHTERKTLCYSAVCYVGYMQLTNYVIEIRRLF